MTMTARLQVLGWAGAALLGGCVAPPPPIAYLPPPVQQPAPLVAVPGPSKNQAAFQADDGFCRAEAARVPAAAANLPPPANADAMDPNAPVPPGVVYLRCMTARGNQVQPLQAAAAPVLYAYPAAYPVYAGVDFGFPLFYDSSYIFSSYGRRFYGPYYGGFYRGYGGGFYRGGYGRDFGGYRGGGFRDGGRGGGFGRR